MNGQFGNANSNRAGSTAGFSLIIIALICAVFFIFTVLAIGSSGFGAVILIIAGIFTAIELIKDATTGRGK